MNVFVTDECLMLSPLEYYTIVHIYLMLLLLLFYRFGKNPPFPLPSTLPSLELRAYYISFLFVLFLFIYELHPPPSLPSHIFSLRISVKIIIPLNLLDSNILENEFTSSQGTSDFETWMGDFYIIFTQLSAIYVAPYFLMKVLYFSNSMPSTMELPRYTYNCSKTDGRGGEWLPYVLS